MYLKPANQKPAGDLLNGVLWADMKRCLMDRRPHPPEANDEPHIAAAKGHKRAGFEAAIDVIEKLPFEFNPDQKDPFSRPAVRITED